MNKKELDKIWEHIETINREMGEVKTDVNWLKKFQWVLITAILGGIAITFFMGG